MRRGIAVTVALASCAVAVAGYAGCDDASSDPSFVDTDGDGLSDVDETNLYHTSPVLADTDGDGISDGDEIIKHAFDPDTNPYRFNPRIADLPALAVVFTSPPIISLQLTTSDGVTQTFETSQSMEQSASATMSTAVTNEQEVALHLLHTIGNEFQNSAERSTTFTLSPAITDGGGGGAGGAAPTDGGAAADGEGGRERPPGTEPPAPEEGQRDAGPADGGTSGPVVVGEVVSGPVMVMLTNGSSATSMAADTVDQSMSAETSFTLTNEQTQQYSYTLEQAQSYEDSHNVVVSSAVMRLTAVLTNVGHLGFRVTDLLLSATFVDAQGAPIVGPIGNLTIDAPPYSQYQPFALAPLESSGPVNFINAQLTLDIATAILHQASAVSVQLGVYELSGPDGPFAFNVSDVAAKTATVFIDYGGRLPPERYLVATNIDPRRRGVSADDVLRDTLRIPLDSDPNAGLTALRGVGANSSDGGAFWVLEYTHYDGDEPRTTTYAANVAPYDLHDITLRAGDALFLAWRNASMTPSSAYVPPRRAHRAMVP